jgi:hypothetical protein
MNFDFVLREFISIWVVVDNILQAVASYFQLNQWLVTPLLGFGFSWPPFFESTVIQSEPYFNP